MLYAVEADEPRRSVPESKHIVAGCAEDAHPLVAHLVLQHVAGLVEAVLVALVAAVHVLLGIYLRVDVGADGHVMHFVEHKGVGNIVGVGGKAEAGTRVLAGQLLARGDADDEARVRVAEEGLVHPVVVLVLVVIVELGILQGVTRLLHHAVLHVVQVRLAAVAVLEVPLVQANLTRIAFAQQEEAVGTVHVALHLLGTVAEDHLEQLVLLPVLLQQRPEVLVEVLHALGLHVVEDGQTLGA